VFDCDGSGACTPPTTFDYEAGSLQYEGLDVTSGLGPFGSITYADINNDGKDDAILENVSTGAAFPIAYALNDGHRFANETLLTATDPIRPVVPVGQRGDSYMFAQKAPGATSCASGDRLCNREEATAIRIASVNLATKTYTVRELYDKIHESTVGLIAQDPFYVADLDGDSRMDLIAWGKTHNWWWDSAAHGENGMPFGTQSADPSMYNYVAPLDGTGKTAFIWEALDALSSPTIPHLVWTVGNPTTGAVAPAQETTLPASVQWTCGLDVPCNDFSFDPDTTFYYLFVDLNGDGSAEAIQIPVIGTAAAARIPRVAFNSGAGFGDLQPLPGFNTSDGYALPSAQGYVRAATSFTQIMDWDGDGLPDILVSQPTNIQGQPHDGHIRVYQSRGAGGLVAAGELQSTAGTPLIGPFRSLDFDGDGQTDLILDGGVFRHAGNKPDQMTGVHDGLGKDIAVTYKSIGDASVYAPDTTCVYPVNCTNRGIWVVSDYSETADWGADGKPTKTAPPVNRFSYTYSGGRSDLHGRGWLGFHIRTETDQQTHATTTTTFNNLETDAGFGYPQAGMPSQTVTTASTPILVGGAVTGQVTRTTNTITTYDVQSALGGRAGYARPSVVESLVQDETAPANGSPTLSTLSHTITTFGYDGFNNETSRVTSWGSGETRSSAAQYVQNTNGGKNLLSLLKRTDDTSTLPGAFPGRSGPSVTRSHTYSPDLTTGLVRDETIQPEGDPTQKLSVHYDRNAFGQVTHVTASGADPLNAGGTLARESWIVFDRAGDVFPARTINALGHTTRLVYHEGMGLLAFAQDPNGATAEARYDFFGRPRMQIAEGQGTLTEHYQGGQPYYLEGASNVPGLYSVLTQQDGGGQAIATYNALGDEVVRGAMNHDGTFSYVETLYSSIAGQVQATTRPHPFSSVIFIGGIGSTAAPLTAFAYDNLERPTTTTLPDGSVISTSYNGLATTVVDPNNHARTRIDDDHGRVVRVDEDSTPGHASTPGAPPPSTAISTAYSYGPFDQPNLVTVTGRGGSPVVVQSAMGFDALGRRTTLVDADSGQTVTSYDAFGESVTEVDANGQTHIESRDVLGRVFSDFSTQDGMSTVQWDVASHGIGLPGTATSTDGVATTYSYNAFGQSVGSTTHIAGSDYSVGRTLDPLGRVTAIQYPPVGAQHFSVTLGVDTIGETKSVASADHSLAWSATAWDPDGQLTQETFGTGGTTTRTHDAQRGWLTDITSTTPAETLQNLHFDHDASGNVKGRRDFLLGTTETFGHDFLDRLGTWGFSSTAGSWNTTFDYDDLGNIRKRTTTGTSNAKLTYDSYGARDAVTGGAAGIHAVTSVNGAAYGYDQAGHQLSGPGRTVGYTSFDLPKKVTTNGQSTTFQYDAGHGRALKKSPNGASTVSVGGLYEKRTDTTGNVTHVFFVPGTERVVAQIEWGTNSSGAITSRKTVYLHDDHLGSVDAVSSDGTTTQHLKYDPFGQRIDPQKPTTTVKAPADITDGFSDQQHDDELGLINFQGRIYDPRIGRFLSADPLVGSPTTSQGFNRYSYVLNNPLALVDPSGFDEAPAGQGSTDCSAPRTGKNDTTSAKCEGSKKADKTTVDLQVVTVTPPPPPTGGDEGGAQGGSVQPGANAEKEIKAEVDIAGRSVARAKLGFWQRVAQGAREGVANNKDRITEGLIGAATAGIGLITYYWAKDVAHASDPSAPTGSRVFAGISAAAAFIPGAGEAEGVIGGGRALKVVALDTNALIGALKEGRVAAVDAAIAGRIPVVPISAAKEFIKANGSAGAQALREFLAARGGRLAAAGSESAAAALRAQAAGMGRALRLLDSRIAVGAIEEGAPLITNDKKFARFLSAIGYSVEGW
jgi:RHS repeat-associated protein